MADGVTGGGGAHSRKWKDERSRGGHWEKVKSGEGKKGDKWGKE